MHHASSTSHGSLHGLSVCQFLTFHLQALIQQDGRQPEVRLHTLHFVMERNTLHISKSLLVHLCYMTMMTDMIFHHRHLSTAYAGTNITHPVIIADSLMLIIRISLTSLSSIPHNLLLGRHVRTNQCAASRGRNHLITIERQHPVLTERAQHLTAEPRAKALGCIFYHRNPIAVGNLHDAVNPVRHAIQSNGYYRLRLLPSLGDAVFDSLLHQFRVHVPCIPFRVNKHWRSSQVGYRVRRSAERKRLHNHLVARSDATCQQPQVYSGRSRAQCHHLFRSQFTLHLALITFHFGHKLLQVILKPIHVRPKRHHPVRVKRLLYIFLFHPGLTHVG